MNATNRSVKKKKPFAQLYTQLQVTEEVTEEYNITPPIGV
jgi:hypothetical protein